MTDRTADRRPEADPVLAVDGVSLSFGEVTVFEDVSARFPPGTVTALVGPNGSGKTSLAEVVAGLRRPDAGDVALAATGERPVGFLPQAPRFRPSLTVAETLRFYADLLDGPTDVEAAMAGVGLAGAADRRVDALSGGMRRLLGLATGFLGDPALAVLDEPTSGLDPRMTRRVFEAAATRAEGGTAVLLTTHDLTAAADADRVLVLDRGGVVARGSPAELVERTGTDSLAAAFFEAVGTEATVRTGVT
ncbi:ABC transporter ATP-binding protein [Halostella litorea]|uniref:ABC transporter ATP-binding protein n=1 Tax=Halostella litorea TaxID=2528831 RepID=UPI00109186B6|nr:ABC transporter ATP-binding protein [Halostella litorea]